MRQQLFKFFERFIPTCKVPPTLYKYCDLRGIDVLQNLRLKVTPFNEFNDPFELAPRMRLADSDSVARTSILKDPEILKLTYRRMHSTGEVRGSYDDFVAFLTQHTDRITGGLSGWFPAQADEFRRTHVNNISKEFGLICFSAHRDVILMWSHYTRGHTGLVIGFDTSQSVFSEGPPLLKVEYRKHRALLDYPPKRHDPRRRRQIRSLIRRKSPEWKYEGEWRQQHILANCSRVANAQQPTIVNYYLPITAACISEVILGCRCEDRVVHTILRDEKFRHVRLLRCLQDDKNFKLSIAAESEGKAFQ